MATNYDDDDVVVVNDNSEEKKVGKPKDNVFVAKNKEAPNANKQAVGNKAGASVRIAKAKIKIANTKLSAAQAKKDKMKRKEAEEALFRAKQAQEEVDRIARLANINRQNPDTVKQMQAVQYDDQGGQYFTGEDGIEYFLDKEGNYFYLASDGKYYLLEPEKDEVADQPEANAKEAEVVVDDQGGQYFTGDDGVEYYLDKDGNYFYLASDGQYHFLEQEEETQGSQAATVSKSSASNKKAASEGHYYVGDDGYNYYQDENGVVFYEADDGKYYPLEQTKSKTKSKAKAEKTKDKKEKTSSAPENDVDDVITKKKLTQRFGFKMAVLAGILVFVLAVAFGALGGAGYFNSTTSTFQFVINRQTYIGDSGDIYVFEAREVIAGMAFQPSLTFDIRVNFNGPASGALTVSVEGPNVANISNGVTTSKRVTINNNQTITVIPNTITTTVGIQEITTPVGGLITLVAENNIGMARLPIMIDREMANLTAPEFKLTNAAHTSSMPSIIRAPENPAVLGSPMTNFAVPDTVPKMFKDTTARVGALPIPTNNKGVAVDPSQFLRNVVWEVVATLPSSFMPELTSAQRARLPRGAININNATGAIEAVKSGYVNLRAGVERTYDGAIEWRITSYVIAVVDVEADTLSYVWPESESYNKLQHTMYIGVNEVAKLGLDSLNNQRVLPKGHLTGGLNDWVVPDAAGVSTNFVEQLNAFVIPARDIVSKISSLVTGLDATYLLDTENFVLLEHGNAGRVSINWFFDDNGERHFVIYATQNASHASSTVIDIYLQGSLISSNKFGAWLSERTIRIDAIRNHSVILAQQGVFFPSPIELTSKGTVSGVSAYTSPMLNQVLAAGRYNILLTPLAQVLGHNFTFSDLYFCRESGFGAEAVADSNAFMSSHFVTVVNNGVREVYAKSGTMWDDTTKYPRDENGNIRIYVQLRNGDIVLDRMPIDIKLN